MNLMKSIPKKIWVPAVALSLIGVLFFHNRPVEFQKAVLMSTPLMFRDGLARPYERLPEDIRPPEVDIFFATDRQPSATNILYPLFYGNDRNMTLSLGRAGVRFGDEDMAWPDVERASFKKDRSLKVPLQVARIDELSTLGNAEVLLEDALRGPDTATDRFIDAVRRRLARSETKDIYIFVPGFKVDFAYPVLVAAELWHYMGYPGAFIAYSWPSRQRLRDYLTDMETTAFTAQHFRMLLIYLAINTDARRIHILSYSAGARIVSQALYELRLMGYGYSVDELKDRLKIGQVLFAAPDIDLMLFAARYRDRFEDIADTITIYLNANDTALNWALRFLGWPRLGAPGELGLTPEELRSLHFMENTMLIDVAAAENAASGNGHGYFIKSPWVSTDLILAFTCGAPPAGRGLVRKEKDVIWKFPGDYPQKIKGILASGEPLKPLSMEE